MVAFRVPELKGWRSLKPSIVSAKRAHGRAAVTIRCVGQPGKLCFGTARLSRNGKRVGSSVSYAVQAHDAAAKPEIVRYLPLPNGSTGGFRAELSNGLGARLR